jgi:hypothetical protein
MAQCSQALFTQNTIAFSWISPRLNQSLPESARVCSAWEREYPRLEPERQRLRGERGEISFRGTETCHCGTSTGTNRPKLEHTVHRCGSRRKSCMSRTTILREDNRQHPGIPQAAAGKGDSITAGSLSGGAKDVGTGSHVRSVWEDREDLESSRPPSRVDRQRAWRRNFQHLYKPGAAARPPKHSARQNHRHSLRLESQK